MGIFDTIENNREMSKLRRMTETVLALEDKFKAMTDEELSFYVARLKDEYNQGKTLDELLPETYALVREASSRVLGMKHYPEQIMGGICLHQGNIAEMATGEGKTLVETLPAVLHALTGEGVHIITSNEYLVKRDAEQMSKLYKFLGLETGVSLTGQTKEEKQKAYACDITYVTATELVFDHERDSLLKRKEDCVLRGHNFVIIDELDSTLLDEATTPYVLSSAGEDVNRDMLTKTNQFVQTLTAGGGDNSRPSDYEVDLESSTVILTEAGSRKADKFFGVNNIYAAKGGSYLFYIRNALNANYLFDNGRQYIVEDGVVKLVDPSTGRIMNGKRYSGGLHQALEVKEGVEIRRENTTLYSITAPAFFGKYKNVCGMTGTAKTDSEELRETYGLRVVTIPTHRPKQRIDEETRVFATREAKMQAIVESAIESCKKGQPVLIGTDSVENSEFIASIFEKLGLVYQVLNAKNHEQESKIIAQAGRYGAITIATNMAGRGTDIKLGGNPTFMAKEKMEELGYSPELIDFADSYAEPKTPEEAEAREQFKKLKAEFKVITDEEKEAVLAVGGLRVIGTELNESRRVDDQLRGRAGRQGDPGSSQMFISLEDDIFKRYQTETFKRITKGAKINSSGEVVDKTTLKYIKKFQTTVESLKYSQRKYMQKFEAILALQRKRIFEMREKLLTLDKNQEYIRNIIRHNVESIVYSLSNGSSVERFGELRDILKKYKMGTKFLSAEYMDCTNEQLIEKLSARLYENYEKKMAYIQQKEPSIRLVERSLMLEGIDKAWQTQLVRMADLKDTAFLWNYSGKDIGTEYAIQGHKLFERCQDEIASETMEILFEKINSRVEKYVEIDQEAVASLNAEVEKSHEGEMNEDLTEGATNVSNKAPKDETFDQ